jgi:acyl carrier protein
MSLEENISVVFRQTLELSDEVDLRAVSYRSIPEWDSVAHMALVAALEDQFDVMFETEDILEMSDLSKAVGILARLGTSNE